MIHFLVPAAGAFTMREYFPLEPPELVARFRVLPYEELPALTRLQRGTYVLAGLERVTPAMQRCISRLRAQLAVAEGVRVLNDPDRSLGRVDLLLELHRSGWNDFRAVRADGDFASLRYPVFLREAQSHEGNLSPLLESPRRVERAIGRALLQGYALGDLVVIEFCDTADREGLYRKYSAYRVGERILARSLNHGRHWMLKLENSEFTRPEVLEEQEYVFENPHSAQLRELFELAAIEYGQIDYSFKDGRIQTWEINLNPTIGRGPGPVGFEPAELRPLRGETREYFFDRFREAWAAIDLPSEGRAPVPVTLEPELVAAVAGERLPAGRGWALLRSLLRPVKPVLEPIAAPFLRLLAILGRSRRGRSNPP